MEQAIGNLKLKTDEIKHTQWKLCLHYKPQNGLIK